MIRKVSVIGLGPMGLRYIKALSKVNLIKLTSICDVDKNKLADVVLKVNKYTDYKQLINNEEIDLLIVASTAASHSKIVTFASKYGVKRIICEKPIAISLNEAKKMIDSCKRNNTKLTINHSKRWFVFYKNIKKLIDNDTIGKVKNITVEMAGGQLGSNGGHHWDLIRFLTGSEVIKICGVIDKTGTVNPRGHLYNDPGAYGILILKNKTRVFFDLSEDFGTPFFMKITGEYGRITIDEKNNKCDVYKRKISDRALSFQKRPKLIKVNFKMKKTNLIEACISAINEILSSKKSSCDGLDGYKSLETTIGIYKSFLKQKKFVDLKLNEKQKSKLYRFA